MSDEGCSFGDGVGGDDDGGEGGAGDDDGALLKH